MKVGDEVFVGPELGCGTHRPLIREGDDGKPSCEIVTCGREGIPPGASEVVTLKRLGESGRCRVTEVIRLTARTPAATNAYRAGWDQVFGSRKATAN